MADTMPGAAPISPIVPDATGGGNSQLLDVLTALLHSNPPATSVDQASPEVQKAAADTAAATGQKPADKPATPAEEPPKTKEAKASPAAMPQALTDAILNMGQITPVSPQMKASSAAIGPGNNINSVLDALTGKDAGGGKSGDASKIASTLHTVAKLAALFA